MGTYQSDYWQSDGWGMSRRETQSGTYHPYLPDLLTICDIALSAQAANAVSLAERAIVDLGTTQRHLTNAEPLARLILRSEALSSSRIEGLEIGAGKLLEFEALEEMGVSHRLDGTEAAVLANIKAMQHVVEALAQVGSVTLADICEINAMLLKNTHMAGRGGVLRTEQNWIGGNNVNPIGAAYVPPRPADVPRLMEDLVAFCTTSPLPPLAVAAIAHAQLETIHPFVDGNGRTGRALVHILLGQAGIATKVVPPVSLVLATDKARYINHLAAYRTDDADPASPGRQAALSDWVEYFANACLIACERAEGFERRMEGIRIGWHDSCPARRGSAAFLLIDALVDNPVVSVASAARLVGRSQEAARLAVNSLVEKGVLVQNARSRKSGIYAAPKVIDAFAEYERSLATPGGDASAEKPARKAPQRVPAERRRG